MFWLTWKEANIKALIYSQGLNAVYMKVIEMIKRAIFLLVGVFITAFGLAVCVKGNLGISPIATLPNALNRLFPGISLGMFSFFQQCVFFVLTLLLLRKDFKPYQLLIVPVSYLFGRFVDFGSLILAPLVLPNYFVRILFVLVSCVIIGLGFSIMLCSGIPLDANTAFLKALTIRSKVEYSKLKVLTDVIMVVLAAVVGFAFLNQIVGIREGTIISAVIIGPIAGFFNKRISKIEDFFVQE